MMQHKVDYIVALAPFSLMLSLAWNKSYGLIKVDKIEVQN